MRAAKVDANQREIVSALRAHRCLVEITSSAHNGFTDLVVYSPILQAVYLIEVKGEKGTLTPKQVEFHERWKGTNCCHVVRSIEEALTVCGYGE